MEPLNSGSTPKARKRAPPGSHSSVYCLYSVGTEVPSRASAVFIASNAAAMSSPSKVGAGAAKANGRRALASVRSLP